MQGSLTGRKGKVPGAELKLLRLLNITHYISFTAYFYYICNQFTHISNNLYNPIYLNKNLRLKAIFIVLFFFAFSHGLSSQPRITQRNSPEIPKEYSKNIQNEYRKIINLNGEWTLKSVDPKFQTKIQVPFSYDFKGKVTCSRTFNIETGNPDNWNYVLCCDGINYQCEITVNGRFIVKHEGGFTSFSTVIQGGIIKENDNSIEIKIDNELDYSKTLPLKNTCSYPKNYGGIYRDIYILAVPKLFIRNVNINSEIDINFNADIKTKITLTSTDLSSIESIISARKLYVKTDVLDSSGDVVIGSIWKELDISPNSTFEVENELSLGNPRFWTPDHPYLYTVRVSILAGESPIDVYSCDYGVYELAVTSNALILNRTEIKLKGVNYVEEFPGSGMSGSYDEVEYDVRNIKTMGCNVIKVLGRPASPYLINLCNRLGLMIFEELPVYNVPKGVFELENFNALAENQLSEMILEHKNNPSIAAYGLGNDFDVTDNYAKNYVSSLFNLGKKLDKRFIYYSTRNYRDDICKDIVDFVGINNYDNNPGYVKELSSDVRLKRNRIFIASYGKIIDPTDVSGYSDPNSIEAQSKYIVDFQKIIKNSSFAGSFFYTYADWNSDYPNLKFFDTQNQYLRTTGLLTINRDNRSSASILKKEFFDEDIPNLNIGTYSTESPVIFVLIGLFILIVFIYLANSVRRFRDNVWRAFFRPFIFYTDIREQSLIPPFQSFLLAIVLSIGNALFFANLLYYWRDSQLFDIMFSLVISSDSAKIYADDIIISPFKLTLVLSAIAFVKLFFFSVIIWFFSLATKFRIRFGNIYTVTIWGFLPTIILLAIGTFYVRLLNVNSDFVVFGLILAMIIYIISVYRVLKGTHIIFDTFFLKAYAYGIGVIIVLCGSAWIYLNSAKFFGDYLDLVMMFLKV